MRLICLLAALILLTSNAFSGDLPQTDSTKYCQSISGLMADGPIKDMAMTNCMSAEVDAAKKLAAHWNIVPESSKQSCVSLMKLSAAVSNQGLLGCATMAVGAACMDGSLTCK